MFCLIVHGNSVLRKALVLIISMILVACSGFRPTTSDNDFSQMTKTSAYYLQQMQRHSYPDKTNWQLLAVRALIKEGKYQAAQQLFTQLPTELRRRQSQEKQLLKAQLCLINRDNTSALSILNQLNPRDLMADHQLRYYKMFVIVGQWNPSIALLRAYITLEPSTSGVEHQKNIDTTWETLLKLSANQLKTATFSADEVTLQGWLDLLTLYNANAANGEMLKAAIQDWQARYPQNPAAITLPTSLIHSQQIKPASTKLIALLLPMSGQAKVFSASIQKGFHDARQSDEQPSISPTQNSDSVNDDGSVLEIINSLSDSETSGAKMAIDASSTEATQVKVYDTANQTIAQILQQVQNDGATLVVGPLLKSNVQKIINSETSLNVLALNKLEKIQARPNICFFSLSPEDEAHDAAQHIWQQGKRKPVLFVPGGAFGDRVSKEFTETWQQQGGGVVLRQSFSGIAQLNQALNSRSGFSLTGSSVIVNPSSTSSSVETNHIAANSSPTIQTQSGIDSIYIVASAKELQLIKPMIDLRVGSRSKLALYTSSRSIQANSGADFRIEMEGLQFSDIPLLSGKNPMLLQQAESYFNNDYSQIRLYAMGYDVWTLASHYNQMREQLDFSVQGNTGLLRVNQDCVISREVSWNQFQQGKIIPVE